MRLYVADLSTLEVGRVVIVEVNGRRLALCRPSATELYALDDTCSHAKASLGEGTLHGYELECPRHGALFDVRSGEPVTLPATRPVRTYPVIVEGNSVFVEVSE